MAGSDWNEVREQTHLLAEEARTAVDRIDAEVRAMEAERDPKRAATVANLRASVRSIQSALTQTVDMHGVPPTVVRPTRSRVDALTLAGELAHELTAEGVPVRVEGHSPSTQFYCDRNEIRRILKALVERAVAANVDADGGWIVLGFASQDAQVVFEVPWNVRGTAADAVELTWLERAVRRQAGTLTTQGGVARVVLPSSIRGGEGKTARLEQELDSMRRRSELAHITLDAARRQGAAYAADVGRMFSEVEARDATINELTLHRDRVGRLVGTAVKDLRGLFAKIARVAETLAPTPGTAGEAAATMLHTLRDVAAVIRRMRDIANSRGSTGTSTISGVPPPGGSPHA